MATRIKRSSSRLVHAKLVVADEAEFWSRPAIPDMPGNQRERTHVVEDGERIEVIAAKYYNRQDWWWIIAHRNNLMVLPSDLYPGKTIVIPDARAIRQRIFP
jgi:hypothetical protein